MNKFFLPIVFFLSALLFIRAEGQPSLTYKMANPRIYRSIGNGGAQRTRLQYDIFVKASATGTYFYGAQLAFICGTPTNFNNTTALAISYDLTTGILATTGAYIVSAQAWGVPATNFGMGVGINGILWAGSNVVDACVPLTTSYQLLCTLGVEISAAGASSGMAQLTFDLANMPGGTGETQTYMLSGETIGNPLHYYSNPARDLPEFSDLYLGRMYCNKWNWSEYSTSGLTVQPPVVWSNVNNTSIWDTTTFMGASGPAPQITATNCQINNLRIHGAARLKIVPGGQLTCSGATDINEPTGLCISSDATGTGSFIDNGTINYNTGGSAMAAQYLAVNKWHGYCIPISAAKTSRFINYYMKWYDNTVHHFKYVIDPAHIDSTMGPTGLGFMTWSASGTTGTNPVSPIGQLNTAFPLPISITVTRPTFPATTGLKFDDWNMIGNPFPSAVDLSSANITWNNVIHEAYFWDPGTGTYKVYIKGGSGTHTQFAPAQQGFFVRHDTITTIATNFVYVDNSVRTHNTEAFLKDDFSDMLRINVVNSTNSYSDIGIVRFSEGTTPGLDENIDALKLDGDADAPQLYFPVPGDHNLIVNVLPWTGINQVVPMSFKFTLDGSVTITATNLESFRNGTKIYLEDKKDASLKELSIMPDYTFTSLSTDDPNRFALHFYNPFFGIEGKNLAGMQIYSFEKYVYVRNLVKGTTKGTIEIFDLLGRKAFSGNLKDMELNKYLPGVNEGYYMVRVVTEDNAYTQKVYLQ
jgi:hypothetical protein